MVKDMKNLKFWLGALLIIFGGIMLLSSGQIQISIFRIEEFGLSNIVAFVGGTVALLVGINTFMKFFK